MVPAKNWRKNMNHSETETKPEKPKAPKVEAEQPKKPEVKVVKAAA